jgi:hypothetical protein
MSKSALEKTNQFVVAVAAVYDRRIIRLPTVIERPTQIFQSFLSKISVLFDSLAHARLALRANLRLVFLTPALALGCVLYG